MSDIEGWLGAQLKNRADGFDPGTAMPPELGVEVRWRRRRKLGTLATLVGAVVVAMPLALLAADNEPGGDHVASRPHEDSGRDSPQGSDRGTPSIALADGGSANCVQAYDEYAIRERAFAVDATVVAIGPARGEDPYVEVTLRVLEAFAPPTGLDPGTEVQVSMLPPGTATVDTATYNIGSRLLVSGEPRWGGEPLDEPTAWACGFSRTYNTDTAAAWRAAVASEPGS